MTKWSRRGAPLTERLTDHSVHLDNGCIEWTAARDKDGYGKIQVDGRTLRAHTVAWSVINSEAVPAGKVVRHTCDNPPCISGAHLMLGDELSNAEDRVHRSRFNKESARYNVVKLSIGTAREIRAKHARGVSYNALATEYGVGRDQISRVINHRNWKERTCS
jgi:hypothetical protein